jgi:hypothetical protein
MWSGGRQRGDKVKKILFWSVAGPLWLLIRAIKIALIAAAALIVLATAVGLFADRAVQLGALVGLMLGALLGPVRIAGVDFRQWMRNPGAPSEIGDDSPVGLMRLGFHNLAGAALLASLLLVAMVSSWVPRPCTIEEAWSPFEMLPFGKCIVGFLTGCAGFPAGAKVVAGGLAGIVAMQVVTLIVWLLGLRFGLPEPARTQHYLARDPLPRLPPRPANRPPDRRRLIVCCDGTWNWPAPRRETNVVRLVRAIAPSDNGIAQIVHYHQGVGTGNVLDRLAGGGAGVGLSASVKACYGFLTDNYQDGDEIYLFGFSRGAYVARALSGFICAVGMMRKYEMDRFADVWKWYWQPPAARVQQRATLNVLAPDRVKQDKIEIECIGVWDTVGALGIPGSRFCAKTFAFHDTELGLRVRFAFQGLAIDERRGNFQPAVWVPARNPPPATGDVQVLEQVWFPGVHSNVGGGYDPHGCSDTSFLWMLSALERNGLLGLINRSIVGGLDANERYPMGLIQNSRKGFWSWVGNPIPRPVCIISRTEMIHESAWERAGVCPPKDIYRRGQRRGWLTAMMDPNGPDGTRELPRTALERNFANLLPPARPTLPVVPRILDLCSELLKFLRPQG